MIKSRNDFEYLREGKSLFGHKQFDKESIEAFNKIEKHLIDYLSTSLSPDDVLNNFVRIVRYSKFPSIWYKAFADKNLFNSFLKVCEFSQKSADILSSNEDLQEFFLTKKVFEPLTKKTAANLSLNKLIFILSINFTLKKISSEIISEYLVHFYKHKIISIAESIINPELSGNNFFIASLGSVGTGEVNFHSDIDLLFITDGTKNNFKSEKIFQKLLSVMRKELLPIEIDCRLKPEGKNSSLVWSFEQYRKYLSERARIWELQALTKVNFVYGNKNLFNKFIKLVENRIANESEVMIRNEVAEMRKKIISPGIASITKNLNIKKAAGGLTDIEFLIQLFILCNPFLYKNIHGKYLLEVLDEFDDSIFPNEDKAGLEKRYTFLKQLIFVYQNLFNSKNVSISTEQKNNLLLSFAMGFDSPQKFQLHLDSILKQNKKLFEKYLMRG
jgi:glutamate-ammonia-ligase adenylyltransferase